MNRYIYRYRLQDGKIQTSVLEAKNIYVARSIAISEAGGVHNLIGCRRLYNPLFNNDLYD